MSIDDRGRRAAERLTRSVGADDVSRLARQVEEARRPRRAQRWPAIAAAAVAVLGITAGVLATQHRGDGNGGTASKTTNQNGPTVKIGPQSPIDGKASMMLPVTVTPSTGVHDGDTVQLHGEGFVPGEELGVVMCAVEAGAPVHQGIDACDIGGYVSAKASAAGTVDTSFPVRRVISAGTMGRIDCAASPRRCVVGVGAMADYDRSGGAPISFDESLAPLGKPMFRATPATGLADGEGVVLHGTGFASNAPYRVRQCTDRGVCADLTVPAMSGFEGTGLTEDGSVVTPRTMDGAGNLSVTVHVQRYIAGDLYSGGEPGQETDCAAEACTLSVSVDTPAGAALDPDPVALGFDPALPSSPRPVMSASPTDGLQVGGVVTVSIAGAKPATSWMLLQCADAPGGTCQEVVDAALLHSQLTTDADGGGQLQVPVVASPRCGSTDGCPLPAGISASCASLAGQPAAGSCLLRLIPAEGLSGGAPIGQRVPAEVRVRFSG